MLYHPEVNPDDLWGYHGSTDPNVIQFMNRHHEDKPVTTPDGVIIKYPKESSELPPSEDPGLDSQLFAENGVDLTDNTFTAADGTFDLADSTLGLTNNNLGLADNTLGLAENTLGLADDIFGPADNIFGSADNTLSEPENLFDLGDGNDASMGLYLDDYS